MEKLRTVQTKENLNAVYPVGEPGPGGANHDFAIYPADYSPENAEAALACIKFQKGPRNDPESRRGILDSDLLEIVRNRLQAFQDGPYACIENARALMYVEQALIQLNMRVENRLERGVLGTMEK